MSTNNTLLVVIDTSDDNHAILTRAAEYATYFDSSIQLFSCIYDPYLAGERYFDSSDLKTARQRKLEEQRETLEELAKPMRHDGIDVDTEVVWDHPAYEGIVRKVMRSSPRLVMRNNHYHHAIQRAFFTNDDWNLVRACPAPLMIVRPREENRIGFRIWASVDPLHENDKPGELDDEIVKAAREISVPTNGTLHLVHTYSVSPLVTAPTAMAPVAGDTSEVIETIREHHEQRLNELAEKFEVPLDRVHNLPGKPQSILPSRAVRDNVDLIVMGAVSRGVVRRALLGSTAEKMLDRLPCDLLIVKPPSFESPVTMESDLFDAERSAA